MGPNRRAQDRERAAAEAAAKAKRAEMERKAVAEAQKIVSIWNARQAGGRALWFYPTIGAAITGGCLGCRSPAPPAGNTGQWICGGWTVTRAVRFQASYRPCPADAARLTRLLHGSKC